MISIPALNLDTNGNCITASGAVVSPVTWNSDLEKRLTDQIQDIHNAKIIDTVFKRTLAKDARIPKMLKAIEDWVVGHAIFLGIPSAREKLRLSLKLLVDGEITNSTLNRFLEETSNEISKRWSQRQNQRTTIVILCSSHGGGNVSVATAMKEHLVSELQTDVRILDVQGPLFESSDALYQTTGLRETVLWNELFVDLGLGKEFSEMKRIIEEARAFIPNNHIGLLKEMIAGFNPKLIISTISGFTRLVQLGELGVSLAIQHTDFCLNAKLYGENPYETFSSGMLEQVFVLDFLDSGNFRIWLNSGFQDEKSRRLRECYPAVDSELITSLGHPTGFALPAEILHSTRPQVLVIMGNEGRFSSVCEIVREILEKEFELAIPINLVVICGKSQRTYEHLISLQESLSKQVHLEVFQHVSREKMIELLAQSSSIGKHPGVVISKPGGSTVAECTVMKCYMLMIPVFAWEADNAQYAIAHGVGELRDENQTLVSQLNNIFLNLSPVTHEPLDWRTNLISEIKSIRF